MNLFDDELRAIRIIISDPDPEVHKEGCELLFNLWVSQEDPKTFYDQLIPIAIEHDNLLEEFENLIDNLKITDRITDLHLRELYQDLVTKTTLIHPRNTENNNNRDHSENRHQSRSLSTHKEETSIKMVPIPKVFISYSHKDEVFKDELVIMLTGLQRQNIIDTWQDRRIEAGENWFEAIQNAMQECEIAILLVSSDFIASRFIQEEELSKLFQRRVDEGLLVIPIIVRACLWQSEPIIKDLQALPKDGKPIISFSKENGDRDHVWMEIGNKINSIVSHL